MGTNLGTAPDRVLSSFILAGLRALPTSIPGSRSLVKVRKRSVYLCFRCFILLENLGTNGDKLATGPVYAVLIRNPLQNALDDDDYEDVGRRMIES